MNKRERKLGMRILAPVYGAWLGVVLLNCDYISEFISLGFLGHVVPQLGLPTAALVYQALER